MVIALIESNRLIEFNRRGTSERIDGLLTISQGVEKLAAEHGVHVQAQRLRSWIRDGKLPAFCDPAGRLYVPASALDDLLQPVAPRRAQDTQEGA